jgi:Fic family protein
MAVDFQHIEPLINEYNSLNLSKIIDYDKFNRFAIVHHSSTIEGSTLTEVETRLLLDEGLTPKGKPLLHSLMVQDHFKALLFIIDGADKQKLVTAKLIQQINAHVMNATGSIYNTPLVNVDGSQGVFRKGNVSAGGSYFVNYDKVPGLVERLSQKIADKLFGTKKIIEQLDLSFDAHFDLVTIHPFYDGNGRTSRLLMNFIQHWFGLPLSIVFKEDKADYFQSLLDARANEDISIFRVFMYAQMAKYLQEEIRKYKEIKSGGSGTKKGGGYSLIF